MFISSSSREGLNYHILYNDQQIVTPHNNEISFIVSMIYYLEHQLKKKPLELIFDLENTSHDKRESLPKNLQKFSPDLRKSIEFIVEQHNRLASIQHILAYPFI